MTIGDYITFESYQELVKKISGPRNELLIRLLWDTAGRITEILNIRAKDVYDEKIRIYNLKRGYDDPYQKGNIRLVHPSDQTYEQVEEWRERRGLIGEDTLFTISRQRAWGIVTSRCERYDITTVLNNRPHPHTFRHSRAINMINDGVPPSRVAKYLGHKRLSTTYEYYLDYADSDLVKAENL